MSSCYGAHRACVLSPIVKRDLWKARDAKKEEARMNRLLYLDAQKGKRHYRTSRSATHRPDQEASDEHRDDSESPAVDSVEGTKSSQA